MKREFLVPSWNADDERYTNLKLKPGGYFNVQQIRKARMKPDLRLYLTTSITGDAKINPDALFGFYAKVVRLRPKLPL